MRGLKIILISLYPIIVILLLLSSLKGCKCEHRTTDEHESPIEEFTDTADAVRHAERIGKSGGLKVTLLWNFQGDIDLHVKQPNGKVIYYDMKRDSSTGGFLDTDNQNGGDNSAENIYWEKPPKGKYAVSLVYYDESASTGVAENGECMVVVFQQGQSPKTYKVAMSHVKEQKHITNILIQ